MSEGEMTMKVGDVVTLVSGSPKMTVVRASGDCDETTREGSYSVGGLSLPLSRYVPEKHVDVAWVDEQGRPHTKTFPIAVLKRET